jgi:hypothetical protein
MPRCFVASLRGALVAMAAIAGTACGALAGGEINLPDRSTRYPVTCLVVDARSQWPIAGATCSIEGQSGSTDADGLLMLSAPAGERLFVGAARGYVTGSRAFRVEGARGQTVRVLLEPVP